MSKRSVIATTEFSASAAGRTVVHRSINWPRFPDTFQQARELEQQNVPRGTFTHLAANGCCVPRGTFLRDDRQCNGDWNRKIHFASHCLGECDRQLKAAGGINTGVNEAFEKCSTWNVPSISQRSSASSIRSARASCKI